MKNTVKTAIKAEEIPENLIQAYTKALECFENYPFSHGLNFEIINAKAQIFSIRLTQAARLLLAAVKYNGVLTWVAIELLKNHEYHRSKFKKPEQLTSFLTKFFAKEENEATTSRDEICQVEFFQCGDDELKEVKITAYNNMLIELRDGQERAIETSLPAHIIGAAGSGKSCVGVGVVTKCAEQRLQLIKESQEGIPEVLYITKSKRLAETMKAGYTKAPDSVEGVKFCTYEDLIRGSQINTGLDIVDEQHLSKWLKEYIRNYKLANRQRKSLSPDENMFRDTDKILQELQNIAHLVSLEAYKKIGARNTLFPDESCKEWLFAACEDYKKHLCDKKLIDPAFTKVELDRMSMVVVDEAQDFPPLVLWNIFYLSNGNVVYFSDNNQRLQAALTNVPFIEQLIHKEVIKLNHSYRCPSAVSAVAQRVLDIFYTATRGKLDKATEPTIESDPDLGSGHVLWERSLEKFRERQKNIAERIGGVNLAVVTSEEKLDEARELFHTELVFTPEKIKGLQYQSIILYEMFKPKILRKLDKILDSLDDNEGPSKSNRIQKDDIANIDNQLILALREIYTAITRSSNVLIIWETKENHNILKLIRFLLGIVPEKKPIQEAIIDGCQDSLTDDKSSGALLAEAERLKAHGVSDVAERIKKFVAKNVEASTSQSPASASASASAPAQKSSDKKNQRKKQRQRHKKQVKATVESRNIDTHMSIAELREDALKHIPKGKTKEIARILDGIRRCPENQIAELLFVKCDRTNLQIYGKCVFVELCGSPNISAENIINLFDKNKAVLGNLNAEIFFGTDQFNSPYYLLAYDENKIRVLRYIFDKRQDLFNNASTKQIVLIYGEHSPLRYLLSAFNENDELGKQLFKQIIELHSSPDVSVFAKFLTARVNDQRSMMVQLCLTGYYSELAMLFDKFPQIADAIEIKDLCYIIKASGTGTRFSYNYTTPLLWICDGPDLIVATLLNILAANESRLARTIPPVWYFKKVKIKGYEVAPFDQLASSETGCLVLLHLLQTNDKFAPMVRLGVFQQEFKFEIKNYSVSNAYNFFLLTLSENGISFLDLLFEKNANLLAEITKDMLFKKIQSPNSMDCFYLTVFYSLTRNERGLELLYKIISANIQVIAGISADDLITQFYVPHDTNNVYSVSLLYMLCRGGKLGIEIAFLILENNPEVVEKISEVTFTENHHFKGAAESILDVLNRAENKYEFASRLTSIDLMQGTRLTSLLRCGTTRTSTLGLFKPASQAGCSEDTNHVPGNRS